MQSVFIECDGDRYHDASKWKDDMNRQRILERAGWKFWRCFASTFVINKKNIIQDLIQTLAEHRIEPIGSDGILHSIHCETRTVKSSNYNTEDLCIG
jgi:very-short-patch-repair endonuclease